jgi:origin recognition complex subunit 3
LNPAHGTVLRRALTDPYSYLKPSRHQNPDDLTDIDPDWPDTCIAYKLHEECGRLINLYDWMQAFISVVGQQKENPNLSQRGKGKKRKRNEPDTDLQARFTRAVSELQFLGFIKPSKRKTDHVERLTWGLL